MNHFRTFIFLFALTAFLLLLGQLVGGPTGVMAAFVIAAVLNFGAYWFSDKIVLASMRARPITEEDYPRLYALVRRLSESGGLPMPRLFLIPISTPNAFATGRNPHHAVVVVTQGILDLLSERELAGVLGHELGHVKNQDILLTSIAATMAGAVMFLSRFTLWFGGGRRNRSGLNPVVWIVMMLLAPLAAMLIQMAISRSREYAADEMGSRISGDPLALAGALKKLEMGARTRPMQVNPENAHLFIVNPLNPRQITQRFFSTHPPLKERVRRLEVIAKRRLGVSIAT